MPQKHGVEPKIYADSHLEAPKSPCVLTPEAFRNMKYYLVVP